VSIKIKPNQIINNLKIFRIETENLFNGCVLKCYLGCSMQMRRFEFPLDEIGLTENQRDATTINVEIGDRGNRIKNVQPFFRSEIYRLKKGREKEL
jgi:hypothetical protein